MARSRANMTVWAGAVGCADADFPAAIVPRADRVPVTGDYRFVGRPHRTPPSEQVVTAMSTHKLRINWDRCRERNSAPQIAVDSAGGVATAWFTMPTRVTSPAPHRRPESRTDHHLPQEILAQQYIVTTSPLPSVRFPARFPRQSRPRSAWALLSCSSCSG